MHGAAGTPPHHPGWGVHLTDETIKELFGYCGVSRSETIHNIMRLSHERSYNNRIYVIQCNDSRTDDRRSYVLKVNGRFFGSDKVENEAACLLLLQHFCPQLPTPRIFAWSEDGSRITRRSDGGIFSTEALGATSNQNKIPGWILMSHLPGSALDTTKLSSAEQKRIAAELGNIVRTWRQDIPPASSAANLHFQTLRPPGNQDLYQLNSSSLPDISIFGNVGSGNGSSEAARSLLDFWRIELEWQRTQLESKPAFAENRDAILTHLRYFIDETLPKLAIFGAPSNKPSFVFTHTDLFPRNVLVEGTPPKITGIVDFEFSGFFPLMEEFVQEWDPDPSDDGSEWPAEMHEMFLQELERLGEVIPRTLTEIEARAIKLLSKIRYFSAPWWLAQVGEIDSEQSARDLSRSKKEVLNAIAALSNVTEKCQ